MINVTIGESKTQELKPFPKLMISKNEQYITIVLMEKDKVGTQLYSNCPSSSDYKFKKIDCWHMEYFTDYNEPITLQNA